MVAIGSGGQAGWLQFPALPITSCVTMGQSFSLSEFISSSVKWVQNCPPPGYCQVLNIDTLPLHVKNSKCILNQTC